MKRLLGYIKKYVWYFYAAGTLAMVSSIALDMFNPYLQKVIIDKVIIGGQKDLFKGALLGLIGITLGRAVLGYFKEFLFDLGGSKVILKLRKDLFEHIQTLSFSYFDGVNTGELMSRVKEDADNVMFACVFGFMLFMEQVIYFVVTSVLLFALNWKLALVSLVTMPVIAFVAFRLEKKIGEAYGKISDQRAILNTTAQENIAGVRLVKAFGREKYEIQKFLSQNEENYKLNVEQGKIWANYNPKIDFLSNLVIVMVTGIGGVMVIGSDMTVGTLVAFSNYVFMLIWPMRMIGWLTNILAQCKASLGKIDNLFNEKPGVRNTSNSVIPYKIKGHVEFKNVCFDYNGENVLRDININAKPGSTIAIMGITGAGKTSIINLIGRYYECSGGKITIDGIDIKNIDLKELRKNISVVMQDTFLFSDTIEENIRFGMDELAQDELLLAARDSKVDDFVMEMPDGYSTVIGERGIGLSGGQKQRISIARALARKSRILVLDDSTSALDMQTEYEIQKALEKRKDITKFIIAHRVSAVKNADEILILENGCVVERGTHEQLLQIRGRYYETYCEQFQGVEDVYGKEVV